MCVSIHVAAGVQSSPVYMSAYNILFICLFVRFLLYYCYYMEVRAIELLGKSVLMLQFFGFLILWHGFHLRRECAFRNRELIWSNDIEGMTWMLFLTNVERSQTSFTLWCVVQKNKEWAAALVSVQYCQLSLHFLSCNVRLLYTVHVNEYVPKIRAFYWLLGL